MVDVVSYILISITCFCFGLIVSFQLAHMHYCSKLIILMRRSIATKIIAPIPVEYEAVKCRVPQLMSVLLTEFMSALDIFSVFVEIDFVMID
jgi:hypothetical protein